MTALDAMKENIRQMTDGMSEDDLERLASMLVQLKKLQDKQTDQFIKINEELLKIQGIDHSAIYDFTFCLM